ncbi:unnamed protein product [Oikopleura dioica]|uniref:Uncharacterized protein n=1 Tax=Oikopleura dioica TaxID=34765 RepID=E4YQD6_OIKDI|nr:unnamed protein product [Oikopleura dioica]
MTGNPFCAPIIAPYEEPAYWTNTNIFDEHGNNFKFIEIEQLLRGNIKTRSSSALLASLEYVFTILDCQFCLNNQGQPRIIANALKILQNFDDDETVAAAVLNDADDGEKLFAPYDVTDSVLSLLRWVSLRSYSIAKINFAEAANLAATENQNSNNEDDDEDGEAAATAAAAAQNSNNDYDHDDDHGDDKTISSCSGDSQDLVHAIKKPQTYRERGEKEPFVEIDDLKYDYDGCKYVFDSSPFQETSLCRYVFFLQVVFNSVKDHYKSSSLLPKRVPQKLLLAESPYRRIPKTIEADWRSGRAYAKDREPKHCQPLVASGRQTCFGVRDTETTKSFNKNLYRIECLRDVVALPNLDYLLALNSKFQAFQKEQNEKIRNILKPTTREKQIINAGRHGKSPIEQETRKRLIKHLLAVSREERKTQIYQIKSLFERFFVAYTDFVARCLPGGGRSYPARVLCNNSILFTENSFISINTSSDRAPVEPCSRCSSTINMSNTRIKTLLTHYKHHEYFNNCKAKLMTIIGGGGSAATFDDYLIYDVSKKKKSRCPQATPAGVTSVTQRKADNYPEALLPKTTPVSTPLVPPDSVAASSSPSPSPSLCNSPNTATKHDCRRRHHPPPLPRSTTFEIRNHAEQSAQQRKHDAVDDDDGHTCVGGGGGDNADNCTASSATRAVPKSSHDKLCRRGSPGSNTTAATAESVTAAPFGPSGGANDCESSTRSASTKTSPAGFVSKPSASAKSSSPTTTEQSPQQQSSPANTLRGRGRGGEGWERYPCGFGRDSSGTTTRTDPVRVVTSGTSCWPRAIDNLITVVVTTAGTDKTDSSCEPSVSAHLASDQQFTAQSDPNGLRLRESSSAAAAATDDGISGSTLAPKCPTLLPIPVPTRGGDRRRCSSFSSNQQQQPPRLAEYPTIERRPAVDLCSSATTGPPPLDKLNISSTSGDCSPFLSDTAAAKTTTRASPTLCSTWDSGGGGASQPHFSQLFLPNTTTTAAADGGTADSGTTNVFDACSDRNWQPTLATSGGDNNTATDRCDDNNSHFPTELSELMLASSPPPLAAPIYVSPETTNAASTKESTNL